MDKLVESIVSRYEKHFNSVRQPSADYALNEIIIAENGSLLHHVDKILDRPMERYWKEHNVNGKWHFLRNTQDTYTGDSSKTDLTIPTSFFVYCDTCWLSMLSSLCI